MDSIFPFKLEGSDFVLETTLRFKNKSGFIFDSTKINRTFFSGSGSFVEAKQEAVLEKNFQLLQDKMGLKLQILLLSRFQILHFYNSKLISVPLDWQKTVNLFLKNNKVDEIARRRLEKGEIIIPNDQFEAEINYELMKLILSITGVSVSKDSDELLVLGGELIWSGWFDFYQATKLLISEHNPDKYISFDKYGTWEYALRNLGIKHEASQFSSSLFLPDLLFKNYAERKSKIRIKKGNTVKELVVPDVPYMIFDLGEFGYEDVEAGDYYPRFFLLKKKDLNSINKKAYQKRKELFQSCAARTEQVMSGIVQDEFIQSEVSINTTYPLVDSPQIGKKYNENDTLARVGVTSVDFIKLPVKYGLLVQDGQLVTAGSEIAQATVGGKKIKVLTENSGKVSLCRIDNGFVLIEKDYKIYSMPSVFEGEVSAVHNKTVFNIKTEVLHRAIVSDGGTALTGLLVNGENEQASLGRGYYKILYVNGAKILKNISQVLSSQDFLAILTNENFAGVLQKVALDFNLPVICLDNDSLNNDPLLEKLLYYHTNKLVILEPDRIGFIAPTRIMVEETADGNKVARKGDAVKFINYQSNFRYGKIEKSLSEQGSNYLVNAPDGIFEIRPGNLFLI